MPQPWHSRSQAAKGAASSRRIGSPSAGGNTSTAGRSAASGVALASVRTGLPSSSRQWLTRIFAPAPHFFCAIYVAELKRSVIPSTAAICAPG